MTVDAHTQNLLNELRTGKEINWDYVPALVKKGKISREDAIASLADCLTVVLLKYRSLAQGRNPLYWGQRLSEAEKALEAINQTQTVTYRGIQL